MKKILSIILIIFLFAGTAITGCSRKEEEHILNATVIEAYENTILVEPVAGSPELYSVKSMYIYLSDDDRDMREYYPVGSEVIIGYDGTIRETSPGQIGAYYITVLE